MPFEFKESEPKFKKIERKDPKLLTAINNAPIYKKFGEIRARPAVVGEKINTILLSGKKETENIAKEGDWIVSNPDGEEYIISEDKFFSRYQNTDKEEIYLAKGFCKAIKNPYGRPIEIMASWGSPQTGDKFCLIADICDAEGNISGEPYLIDNQSFQNTYKLFENQDKDLKLVKDKSSLVKKEGDSIFSNSTYLGRQDLNLSNQIDESKDFKKKLSFTREDLDIILNDPNHNPRQILNLLEKDFENELNTDVWGGYSLRQHTLMVMKQFNKYFKDSAIEDKKLFEFTLALHDIGKPQAIFDGVKNKQHEYTKKMLTPILSDLKFTPEEINLADALIGGDPIGGYLQGGDVGVYARIVLRMAKKSGISLEKFWNLLLIYYQVDAGSYTEDAGVTKHLDALFSFHPESGRMEFSAGTDMKIKALKEEIDILNKAGFKN